MSSEPDAPAAPAPAPDAAPRKKTVVFCLPGREFSNRFLVSWTQTMHDLWESGRYNVLVSSQYSSCVHFSRAKCLGASVMRGERQLPFNGQIPYDVLVWLDSDIVFRPQDVVALIEATDVHPVVSGAYMMEDGAHLCCVERWDTDYYKAHGGCFQFVTPERVAEYAETTGMTFMPVCYAGLGFCAFRHGVLEDPRLKYPWFYGPIQRIATGSDGRDGAPAELVDMMSEDVALFRNLTDAGIVDAVMLHTRIRVGHEKKLVL